MSEPKPGVLLCVDPEILRPLMEQVAEVVMARVEATRATLTGRDAYPEAEAARRLGLKPHVLKGERERGRIAASRSAGRRILYTPKDISDYLAARRTSDGG
jgi:hypothetical protein